MTVSGKFDLHNFFYDGVRYFNSLEDIEDFQRNNANGDLARDNQRVGIEFPVDHVGLVGLAVFFFNETIHCVQRVERIGLLFTMNQNRVGKFWSTLLHVHDVIRQIHFLGVFDIGEGENTLAVNLVKRLNFGDYFTEIFGRCECTQQLAIVKVTHRIETLFAHTVNVFDEHSIV